MPNKSLMEEDITLAENAGILTVAINRPERKNAVTAAMWDRLSLLFSQASDKKSLRAIIITGGSENFSAGADISEFDSHRGTAKSAALYEARNEAAFAAIRHCAVPVIAKIRGICFGGGFGLAAAAHLRIASPTARFRVPAARLGLAYPVHSVADIVSGVGVQMARRLLLSAEEISANDALAAGFLSLVAPDDQLDDKAQEWAERIAQNAPLSVQASQLAIANVLQPDATRLKLAVDAANATFESDDYAEGRRAFKDKRLPKFTGQ